MKDRSTDNYLKINVMKKPMEVPPSEIIDRISIVKLKIERIGDNSLKKEILVLESALYSFKKRGIKIDDNWIKELYEINKEEWDLLEEMNKEKEGNQDYAKIGQLYLKTELVNKRRSQAKNKIVELTKIGFKEIKKNHPSA